MMGWWQRKIGKVWAPCNNLMQGGKIGSWHFLIRSSTPDIVAVSQEVECGLKYVIHSRGDQSGLEVNTFSLSTEIMQV